MSILSSRIPRVSPVLLWRWSHPRTGRSISAVCFGGERSTAHCCSRHGIPCGVLWRQWHTTCSPAAYGLLLELSLLGRDSLIRQQRCQGKMCNYFARYSPHISKQPCARNDTQGKQMLGAGLIFYCFVPAIKTELVLHKCAISGTRQRPRGPPGFDQQFWKCLNECWVLNPATFLQNMN